MASRFPQVGDAFGPYAITGQLGQGHAGVVFRARQDNGPEVALKVFRPRQTEQAGFRDTYLREASDLAALGAPHVVTLIGSGEQDGWPYLACELVPGGDLGTRLELGGALPVDLAGTLVAQVAEALAVVHAAGRVHGNLKPGNVLLGDRDGQPDVRLTDFGIVPSGSVVGVTTYWAPECLDGAPPTPASDLYSLGCLLVASVTGLPPYEGTDAEVAEQHRRRAVPSWEETGAVQARLNHLVRRSMAKDPAHRYRSAEEFLADLTAGDAAASAATDAAVEPAPMPPPELPPTPEAQPDPQPARAGGKKALLVSTVVLALVAGVVAGLVILSKGGTKDSPGAQASASPTPTATPSVVDTSQARTCQEGGREAAAGQRCGEPYGLTGLRFVFAGITDACVGKRLNTDKYWQYDCTDGDVSIAYSTYRTNGLVAQHNLDAYAGTSTRLASGLLQYGPEKRADGTYQISLTYDGIHPYGAEITAPSESRAVAVAAGLAVRAPTAFRGD